MKRLFNILSWYPAVYLIVCYISFFHLQEVFPKDYYRYINRYIIHPWLHSGIIPLLLLMLLFHLHRYCVYLKACLFWAIILNLYRSLNIELSSEDYKWYGKILYSAATSILLIFVVKNIKKEIESKDDLRV